MPSLGSGKSRSIAALLLLSVLVVAVVVALVPAAYDQPFSPGVISVSPSTIYEGSSATLSVTTPPGGDYSSYSCEWFAEPPGSTTFSSLASSDCSSSVSTGALSSAGTWSFELQVTSSYYYSYGAVISNVVTVTVLGPDQSFTPVGSLTTIVIGSTDFFEVNWINNIPSAFSGIVWFEVENYTTQQTVMIAATSLTLQPGESAPAYLGLSTLAPGTYLVETFVTTPLGVPISLQETGAVAPT